MTEPRNEHDALRALHDDDPAVAGRAADVLWTLWHQSGKPEIDALMRDGVVAMQKQDLGEAETVFTRIIGLEPTFAEGWNKRATVRYMAGRYEDSISDCRETLARNPNHFGALSGQGLCHMALGQHLEAAAMFRRTLEVHPHLSNARSNLRTAVNEVVKWN